MAGAFFSVLITTYNRARLVERCVRSCMQQTFPDFEIVVVDDASTDGTAAVLAALDEPRLRVVRHDRNRGYVPARATAVDHAQGQWLVMVDSDDELVPHALARLRTLIDGLPPEVHIIRSCHRLDDGRVVPEIMPAGLTDYHGRLAWLESVYGRGAHSDAGHCMHRSVLDTTPLFRDRRGTMEPLWELNLARSESSMWVSDVLGLVHADAPNSYGRGAGAAQVMTLLGDAPDQLWMAETMLAEHGEAITRHAPHYRRWLVESAAVQAFFAGERLTGIRHARAALRAGGARPRVLATVILGMLGPRALASAKVTGRRWRARRAATA